MKAYSFMGRTLAMPKYQNPPFGSIGKLQVTCQTHNRPFPPNYCMNALHIIAFQVLAFSDKIAVILYFKNDALSYYCSAKGCQQDYSLRVTIIHPDSINDIDIKTLLMIGKP